MKLSVNGSTRRHGLLFVTLGGAVAAFVIAACADDATPRTSFDPDPVDASHEADLPPRNDPDAASDRDAGGDARPPVPDGSDEPVVCAVSPCATQLAAGENHVCALMSDGTVQCWGQDLIAWSGVVTGALGRGEEPDGGADGGADAGAPVDPKLQAFTPARVMGLSGVTQVSARGSTSCARLGDGTVRCWGQNNVGQLGLAVDPPVVDTLAHPTPSPVAIGGKARRVAVGTGGTYACAVMETGKVECWGSNNAKQLARDTGSAPVAGPGPADLEDVVRTSATIALTKERHLMSWGNPAARLLGRPSSTTVASPTPAPIPDLEGVTSVDAEAHACAIARGELYCWGSNSGGRLCTGDAVGSLTPRFIPVKHPASVFPQQVVTGSEGSCIRLTDGTVQCCGSNTVGQLGLGEPDGGTAPPSLSPLTPAKGLSGYAVQVAASYSGFGPTVCALLKTGAVTCWGGNPTGSLGLGTLDKDAHPTPTPVDFQP